VVLASSAGAAAFLALVGLGYGAYRFCRKRYAARQPVGLHSEVDVHICDLQSDQVMVIDPLVEPRQSTSVKGGKKGKGAEEGSEQALHLKAHQCTKRVALEPSPLEQPASTLCGSTLVGAGRQSSRRASCVNTALKMPARAPLAHVVASELRETEAAFLRDLRTVLRVYAHPIAHEQSLLSTADQRIIFSNLEAIAQCSALLVEELSRDGDPVQVAVDAFLKMSPFLKLHAQFSKEFALSAAALSRCRRQYPAFNAYVEQQQHHPTCHNLPLEAFLIKPVQRVTKYPLFFEQLQSASNRASGSLTGKERAKLDQAQELVRSIAASVDRSLDDEILQQRTVQLLAELGAKWLELLAPHRRLELEWGGTVLEAGAMSRTLAIRGLVLTDALVLLHWDSRGRAVPLLVEKLSSDIVVQRTKQAAGGETILLRIASAPSSESLCIEMDSPEAQRLEATLDALCLPRHGMDPSQAMMSISRPLPLAAREKEDPVLTSLIREVRARRRSNRAPSRFFPWVV